MNAATTSGGTTNYIYSALGQMIEKSGAGGTTLLMYDEAGHLIGEYDGAGNLIEETVWMGDIPVATLRPNGGSVSVYYVHTDQLNAPRVITRPADNAIEWRWDTDPFGTVMPNQNPAGLGTFIYNLRFPGQYFQAETGVNYNYFRDYDPQIGRYVESDPIGLGGGVNTYAYVLDNPISLVDPDGTNVTMTCRPLSWFGEHGWSIPRHCGVIVWHWSHDCPPRKIVDKQFSLAGFAQTPTRDPNNQTYVDDRNAFNSPGGVNLSYEIPIPTGLSSSQFDAAVINSGSNYSLPAPYWLTGPNSNTAATSIIAGAGGAVPAVPFAPGQFWLSPSFPAPSFLNIY